MGGALMRLGNIEETNPQPRSLTPAETAGCLLVMTISALRCRARKHGANRGSTNSDSVKTGH